MTWLKTGVFCTAMALAGAAAAQGGMEQDEQQGQMGQQDPTGQQGQMGQQDPMAQPQAGRIDVSGVVTEVDKSTNTITVVTPLPQTTITQIGDAYVVDRNAQLVAIQGQWQEDTQIMRDGKTAKIGDLKEGDVVRTSYDAATDSFGDVSAMSKNELKKELKKEMKQMKEEGKEMEKEMP